MTSSRRSRPCGTAFLIAGLVLAGCGTSPPPDRPYAADVARGKAVVPATADLAVVWISNGCSGVLIGRRTVVSARHCAAPTGTEVVFARDRAEAVFASAEVVEAKPMPGPGEPAVQGQLGTTAVDDLQLLRLAEPVPTTLLIEGSEVALEPARINYSVAPVPCAACTRHVGFGRVVNGRDNYQKHSVVSDIDSVTPYKFEFGNIVDGTYRGACHGDSGGAGYMMVGPDELLTGITDAGDDACESESWDIRTDRPEVRQFLTETLAGWQDCSDHNCPRQGG